MKRILSIILICIITSHLSAQGLDATVRERLEAFFNHYQTTTADIGHCKLDSFQINHRKKELYVYPSVQFGYQPFTPETCTHIYRLLKQSLPGPVNYYDITIVADGKPIDKLVPNFLRKDKDKSRLWKNTDKETPWVKNISRPYTIGKGLEGRHIAVWQSHGRFYKHEKDSWEWQ